MSEHKLTLSQRVLTGKKNKQLRQSGLIPSVVYGRKDPILTSSEYITTEKILNLAGYHSPIKLSIAGKEQLAIVKNVQLDPVSRKIINIEFQAISAHEVVEATTPIIIIDFAKSDASKLQHFALTQSMEEINIKAKPADLPKELTLDASHLSSLEQKLTLADLSLPAGVELADKELGPNQVIASLYDPIAEATARATASTTELTEEEAPSEETSADSSTAEPTDSPSDTSKE